MVHCENSKRVFQAFSAAHHKYVALNYGLVIQSDAPTAPQHAINLHEFGAQTANSSSSSVSAARIHLLAALLMCRSVERVL